MGKQLILDTYLFSQTNGIYVEETTQSSLNYPIHQIFGIDFWHIYIFTYLNKKAKKWILGWSVQKYLENFQKMAIFSKKYFYTGALIPLSKNISDKPYLFKILGWTSSEGVAAFAKTFGKVELTFFNQNIILGAFCPKIL